MNVAIYARVSTTAQAEHGYSLETQVEACRKKAVEMGATSIKEYVDNGYSGAYLERPALDSLRDALSVGLHDTVIIYDTDRLARDTMLLLLLTEEIEKNATLVYVNTDYNKTPEGQLFYEIKGSFAKYERIRIQDRFSRGRRGKLRKGLPIGDSHVFGYDFVDGRYVVNEYEAGIVRMIFDTYINTTGGQKNIVNMLNANGIPSPFGLTWRSGTVCNILRRQQYTGEYFAYKVYRKKTGTKKTTDIKRDPSEWIPMTCPPIISKETYALAEDKRRRNNLMGVRETTYQALLQGVARCGVCGKKVFCQHFVDKGKEYYFYKCCTRPGCGNRAMRADIVDTVVWDALCKICESEKVLTEYVKEQKPKTKTVDIDKELKRIEQQRNAIMTWYSQSLISMEQSTAKLQMLKRKEEKLKANIPKDKKINTANIVSTVKNSATFQQKRNAILSTCDRITLIRKGCKYGKTYDIDIKFTFK